MSFEMFDKLEAKVQQAIDTITLLQMEIEELKEKKQQLEQDISAAGHEREALEQENGQLKESQKMWQDRLQTLLGKMDEM